jgi:hypothetical protein
MMKKLKILTILFLFGLSVNTQAAETCSRVAIINYQEVLVDTNSTQKGEGLRFHLEKDATALSYLDKYQEGTQIKWHNAILGTTGTTLILTALVSNASDNNRQSLIIGGASLILINFLVARTLEITNEANLLKAVEEYNKRNLPRIYFGPGNNAARNPSGRSPHVMVEKGWSF